MSFSSQSDVHYLVDQFYYLLLIRCRKTTSLLKRLWFEESGSNKTEPKESKRQRLDENDNEEGNSLDKDKDEIESVIYVPPPFVSLSLFLQKVSNHPSTLGEGTRSLNHLVCISKICYSRRANFALEFPGREGSKAQKKNSTSRLRERLESHSASTASIACGTTNYRCLIREHLESHPLSNHRQDLETQLCTNQRQDSRSHLVATASMLFTNASNVSKVTPLPIEALATGLSLWRAHSRCLKIKDLTPTGRSLCEYTWEVVDCMILTSKGRLGPDIWPETP